MACISQPTKHRTHNDTIQTQLTNSTTDGSTANFELKIRAASVGRRPDQCDAFWAPTEVMQQICVYGFRELSETVWHQP